MTPFERALQALHVMPILSHGWQEKPIFMVNLTRHSEIWQRINQGEIFDDVLKKLMIENKAEVSWGQYNEERFIYEETEHFTTEPLRNLHIGVDLGVPAGTEIQAPIDGIIHSMANNQGAGNYGPTIILQHDYSDGVFYTLYGHLSSSSLNQNSVGQRIPQGETFAQVGDRHENGQWAPHVHFQIIHDLEGKSGDYAGVINVKDKTFYLTNCPNPNLLLRVSAAEDLLSKK